MLAAVRALGRNAEPFLASRGASPAVEQRAMSLAAAARLLATDGAAREREIARLDASPPDGIERVHASWWRRPPPSVRPAARAFLERAATAHLVAMPPPDEAEPLSLANLDRVGAEPLEELVVTLGRRRVAQAFSTAPAGSLAQLCARLGEPAAGRLLAEARTIRPSHDEVRAAQRSLFKLAVDVPDPPSLLLVAGARWLGPSLAALGGDHLRRVAQRLAEPTGRTLLAQSSAPATAAEHEACARAVVELASLSR